jgi:hypothetical protein
MYLQLTLDIQAVSTGGQQESVVTDYVLKVIPKWGCFEELTKRTVFSLFSYALHDNLYMSTSNMISAYALST